MSANDINLLTAPYRLDQRPRRHTLADQIAHHERSIARMADAGMQHTLGYQFFIRELADLLVQAQALEVAANAREGR